MPKRVRHARDAEAKPPHAPGPSPGMRLLAEHWTKLAGYLLVSGLLGYGVTFWRYRGGAPEPWQERLLSSIGIEP